MNNNIFFKLQDWEKIYLPIFELVSLMLIISLGYSYLCVKREIFLLNVLLCIIVDAILLLIYLLMRLHVSNLKKIISNDKSIKKYDKPKWIKRGRG